MDGNDLPLLELFTRLRQAGLPLGIDEYQLVLRSLQAGFGINDQAALKRLCQTLWVKSAEEKHIFEYHFEQVVLKQEMLVVAMQPQGLNNMILNVDIRRSYSSYVALGILGFAIVLLSGVMTLNVSKYRTPKPIPTATPTQISKPISPHNSNTDKQQPHLILLSLLFLITLSAGYGVAWWIAKQIAQKRMVKSTSISKSKPNAPDSALSLEITQAIAGEPQEPETIVQTTSSNITESRFLHNRQYLPVTQRQMKQIWRSLRYLVRESSARELDVEATVNQIGRQGIFLQPVLIPRRVNQAELLLLIDQDGSMVPFNSLSQRLAETAVRGGGLGKVSIYYFHNCPIEYLYHDPYHQEPELVTDVVIRGCSQRTTVLILSDAGAARGRYSKERYNLTQEFLSQLKQQVRYIAWLNPMPRQRWFGTTAGEIARLVPMFELNRQDLQNAVNVLRGRAKNFEG